VNETDVTHKKNFSKTKNSFRTVPVRRKFPEWLSVLISTEILNVGTNVTDYSKSMQFSKFGDSKIKQKPSI